MTVSTLPDIKLAAWDPLDPRKTVIPAGDARIGGAFTLVAGFTGPPDERGLAAAARTAKEAGAQVLGWTADAPTNGRLDFVTEAAAATGLPALLPVTDTKEVAARAAGADLLMVGAPNMQNFSLLKELGRSSRRPVILVRGFHATLTEWLNSAEYILLEGNPQVILCEAGIRSFEGERTMLDLSAVPALKRISHLPVLVDVSAAAGPAEAEKMGFAAIAAGADGLIVDVAAGPRAAAPGEAASGLTIDEFARLGPRVMAMSRLMEGIAIDHP